jgi:replicative DNA helicase
MPDLSIMPRNDEAEEALIGSVIIDPTAIRRLSLSPDDFIDPKLGTIYKAIQSMHREKIVIDYMTIIERLETLGKLEYIGGSPELMRLESVTPTSIHAEAYADIVKDKARRRAMIVIAENMANSARNADNIDAVISETIGQLASKANIKNGAVHISEFVSRLYDEVDKRYQNPVKSGGVSGIPSGFYDFDAVTDGFHLGEETILSAEPGLGKSLLAFQMAYNMSGVCPGAVYQLEMSGLSVAKRQVSNLSKITTRDMNRGTLEDWQAFVKAIEILSTREIYMTDDSRLTTATLRADLARLREDHGIRWFVLDYLSLLKDTHGRDDIERTAWLSSELHGICKDLNLAGLVIHSMNKQGIRENNGNQADLAGSVRVMYDADQIIIMRKGDANSNVVNLKWSKFREGEMPQNGIQLAKMPGFPAFVNKQF